MPALTASGNEINDLLRAAALQGDGRTAPDSSFGIYKLTTNLVPNGGAQTNASGFVNNQASTVQRATNFSKFGTASFKAICNDNTRVMSVEWTDIAGARIAVTAGVVYTFSLFNRDGGGYGKSAIVKILWYDAGGANIATASGTATAVPASFPGDGSARMVVTGTAPANAVSVRLTWTATTTNALNDSYYFDGVQFEVGPTASPYVETNGATATRNAGRVQAPNALLAAAQGFFAIRIRVGFASSSLALYSSPPRLFGWGQDANNRVDVRLVNAGGLCNPTAGWVAGGNGNPTNPDPGNFTFARGDFLTIVFAWTATQIKISVNGGAFVAVALTVGAPTIPTALLQIGSNWDGTAPADCDVMWCATGTGALTSANAATLHGYGNAGPTFSQVQPLGATAVWAADTVYYDPAGLLAAPATASGVMGAPSITVKATVLTAAATAAMRAPLAEIKAAVATAIASAAARLPSITITWPPVLTPLPARATVAFNFPRLARAIAATAGRIVSHHPLTATITPHEPAQAVATD